MPVFQSHARQHRRCDQRDLRRIRPLELHGGFSDPLSQTLQAQAELDDPAANKGAEFAIDGRRRSQSQTTADKSYPHLTCEVVGARSMWFSD